MNDGDRRPSADYGHEFFRPSSALWWANLTLGVLLLFAVISYFARTAMEVKTSLLAFLPFYIVTGLIFVTVMLKCDPYQARRPLVILGAFGAGAALTPYVSVKANNLYPIFLPHLIGEDAALEWLPGIAGPTTEEWTKTIAIVSVMLLAKQTMTRPMHGLMVGGFVGLGFQMVENVVYGVNSAVLSPNSDFDQATVTNFTRFLAGFNSHNMYSAIIGVGVALLLGRVAGQQWNRQRRILGFAGFYALGWGSHFLWNSPPISDSNEAMAFTMFSKVTLAFVVFAFVLRWVWRQERQYLRESAIAVSGTNGDDVSLLSDTQRAAIGTRKERRTHLKSVKKADGRAARKAVKGEMRGYLRQLQAWDRRGTGIDERSFSVARG